MLEPIKYECEIEVDDVPIQWIPLIDIFSPSVSQYPLMYVHIYNKGNRIYGFPTHFSVKSVDSSKKNCTLVFNFISNKDLENNKPLKDMAKEEIKNRIGLSGKVGLDDLKKSCKGNKRYEEFVEELWNNHVSLAYGDYLPYGRFYDEMYSIVRFLAALAPMSGGKSEEQMVYDFMSHYGEHISIENEWSHFEFFLIPSYEEILNKKNITDFNRYDSLYKSIMKFGTLFFTRTETAGTITLNLLVKGVPISSRKFRELTTQLVSNQSILKKDKENLDFLVDAFNRMPMRAASYMGAIINIKSNSDYRKWSKKEFLSFYIDKDTKGFSMKCAGCFIQQGFGNREVIPIDTWVESFFNESMCIDSKEAIIQNFDDIGRFERFVWLISQARKTNMNLFYDVLWCIRYGTQDKKVLRGPNPISCFECNLRNKCIAYADIDNKKLFIQTGITKPSGHTDCDFVVGTVNNVPKQVFGKPKGYWILIDEYSGLILHNVVTSFVNQTKTIKEFIQDLQ